MELNTKPPATYWLVAILALLWSVIEIYFSAFEIDFLQKTVTAEEFENMQSLPLWYIVFFILAISSETLGVFMLFIRQKIAVKFFAVSLITLLFIEAYWLFIINIRNTSVVFSIIIPIIVIAIATFLFLYSKKSTRKGWLK